MGGFDIYKVVVYMSEIDVCVGKLEERVENMEKQTEKLTAKVESFQTWFLLTLGGLAVNLIVLLVKR
jgi:proteasome assembly chaperone (PAC2) family protein